MVGTSGTSPVCLVHLVSLIEPNKPERPNRPNEQYRLADFSILLDGCLVGTGPTDREGSFRYLFLVIIMERQRDRPITLTTHHSNLYGS